ncbi:arylesterase [Pontibacter flavimaris]|nr:arylesterase [Pontibacter flavimaris]
MAGWLLNMEGKRNDMKNILIFGDSLTAGYGLPAASAYPSLLQEQLRQEGYTDYKVLNGGLSGDTTAGGVHRIDRWLHQPIDIFILALGANDGLRGIPARETSQNLQEIIYKVRQKYPEVKIILSGMEIPDIVPGRYAAEFRKLFRELALQHNTHFIPFLLEGVAGNRLLNLPDGVHPNAQGQKLLARHTWTKLKELL